MQKKISSEIIKSMGIRVTIVIIISSLFAYFHLQRIIKKGTSDTLANFVTQKIHSESFLFELNTRNHQIIKSELIERLKNAPTAKEIEKFDSELVKYPDGTIRNKQKNFDAHKMVQVYIPGTVKINSELKHKIAVMMDITLSKGIAFHSFFENTYLTTPDNILVMYWPEVPNWTTEMKPDIDMTKDEPYWVTDLVHNPNRSTVWTALYYDQVAKIWMVSGVTPLDNKNGVMDLTISHDVVVQSLIDRTNNEHIKGAYNLIFRGDGRLVVHKDKTKEFIASEGVYDILKRGDTYLQSLFRAVMADNGKSEVIYHPLTGDMISYKKINGPEWFLVSIYPKALIHETSLDVIKFIFILGLFSLLIEIYFIYQIVQVKVHRPIEELAVATNKIREGQFDVSLNIHRPDELGEFAKAFESMIKAVKERDSLLQDIVDKRTKELDIQRIVAIHNAKMVTIGEMAAGIAHEINNPLAIIQGNASLIKKNLNENVDHYEMLMKSAVTINSMTIRINKIIKGLLYFSRKGDLDPFENIKVSDLVNDAIFLCQSKLSLHEVELKLTNDSDSKLTFECSRVQMSQVLVNLISNSIDAISSKADEKWIEISFKKEGTDLIIKIKDSGLGLPKEIRDRIFDPFFTTKDVGKGTGIGLSISKGIVEQHSGKLSIDHKSSNTCFVISIPLKHISL
jgi:signal transduction histidine kinase